MHCHVLLFAYFTKNTKITIVSYNTLYTPHISIYYIFIYPYSIFKLIYW